MSKKMLIDASHPEETRIAVVSKNRLEEFDFESKVKASYKSNIYLAKVTRVEPSLQACFVNYGGNRHGFLPFSEIHPDYFRIPVEDREKLMAEQEDLARKIAERTEAAEGEDNSDKDLEDEINKLLDENENNTESNDLDDSETDSSDSKTKSATKAEDTNQDVTDSDVSTSEIPEQTTDQSDETASESDDSEKPKKKTRGRKKKTIASKTSEDSDDKIVEDIPSDSKKTKTSQEDVPEQSEDTTENTEKDKKPKRSRRRSKKVDKDESNDSKNSEGVSTKNNKPDSAEAESTGTESTGSDDSSNGDSKEKENNTGKSRRRYRGRRGGGRNGRGRNNNRSRNSNRSVDTVGGDDLEADPTFLLWKRMRRSYKIQEVIKRGQIMLVQCQKEERGNKGAAMTTYITLPGRYGVLMPNSPRGGGISRKIGWGDRKKLKEVLDEVTIPKGMSVILRTAAVSRTKAEIKRDLEYLYKLWDSIRELTLQSNAPAEVYEEGNLIKRAIRDLYSRDVEEVWVEGEQGYKDAKEFMKMMIPSHAKKIQHYNDNSMPLFHRHNVESQIDEIYDPQVTLKSGGYLVIHPTEALVSIDVNSGRATKGRHIEETALRTNLETADEVARQLRLRDLGGLVVIDFIDMEDYKNNKEVERRLADALSHDRARVQVGHISSFGLLELSRQRLRPSLTETHFQACAHCDGAGVVRTESTAALRVLRAIEEEGIKGKTTELHVDVPTDIGLYILNNKRGMLNGIEDRYGLKVFVRLNPEFHISDFEFERTETRARKKTNDNRSNDNSDDNDEEQDDQKPRRARRTRSRNKQDGDQQSSDQAPQLENEAKTSQNDTSNKVDDASSENSKPKKKSSSSRHRKKNDDTVTDAVTETTQSEEKSVDSSKESDEATPPKDSIKKAKASSKKASSTKKEQDKNDSNAATKETAKEYETVNEAPQKPKKGWWNKVTGS